MATKAIESNYQKRALPWATIGKIALLLFFILFLAVPTYNILLQMIANPQLLLRQLIIGLTNGAYIALIALGYTLVYGIVELINFAHGDVYMLGAFFSLSLVGLFHLNEDTPMGVRIPLILLILFLTMFATAMLNAFIERFAYRRLRNAPKLAPLISALGVSFVLQNVGLLWGYLRLPAFNGVMGTNAVAPKSFPGLLPNTNVLAPLQDVFGKGFTLRLSVRDLVVIIVSVVLLIALYLFVQRTKIGKAMRATAQDRDAAALMGIDVNRTISLAFLLGGALAGAAGFLVGMYNGTVVYTNGFTAGLRSFTAAVLGGIGNIMGAMLGGLLIGLISALSDQYISAKWTNAVVFGLLVLILVFRPTGLLGDDVQQKA
ncbi:branched-chain amino acid ABC transporter permease [Chloroflexia bacterium SDU3-3]|nr:branched-chain amino acid ABC transporter permease [Chloroflexia bacterium SDU3-3]